ncbi:hypothetical protein WN943_024449 [Citrus x changshan-huyou]|uniref:Abhydrolase 3 domain-containing protein n=1 Tax=Citrus sinensis TaxID=2711 RepID=A0ACB8IEY3_CITSI|nr:Abhydrolase 3 domain-containing protein [Citrus sinensis]
MDSKTRAIAHEFLPYFRAYRDGHVERFFGSDKVPASMDSSNAVFSKDVVIVPEKGVSARIFIPSAAIKTNQKLPLLVYYHGGGFFMGSPFCSTYHNYVGSLSAKANVIVVSVDYRLAPEHLVPAAYEDSWAVLTWVAYHFNINGHGYEAWLNDHADFARVFLAGDSAGGNIVHNMAVQASFEDLNGIQLAGICLVQPYFGRNDEVVDKCWVFVCPNTSGYNDVRINPAADSRLMSLRCPRVLVCVAEKDNLRDRGLLYYETLKNCGWAGEIEIVETEGEDHVFHLFNPDSEKAVALMDKLASFLNQDNVF